MVSQRKVDVLVLRRGHVSTRPIVVFVLMTSFQRDRCVTLSQQGIRELAPSSARRCDICLEERGRFRFASKKVHDQLNPLRSRNCSVNLLVWTSSSEVVVAQMVAIFFEGGKREKGLKVGWASRLVLFKRCSRLL